MGIIIILILSITFVADIFFNICGLSLDEAENRVKNELKARKLNIGSLHLRNNDGTCAYYFLYEEANRTTEFIVYESWLDGTKLGSMELNVEGN
jgi:hypothetical protein